MAEIAEGGGGGHHGKEKKRAKKGNTRVDMTPMVDLAFLLLTFFVLTSTFSKPKMMDLAYPAKEDPKEPQKPIKINKAVTFILSENDRIFYYFDEFHGPNNPGKNGELTKLEEADFGTGPTGLRKLLAKHNDWVFAQIKHYKAKFKAGLIKQEAYEEKVKEIRKDKLRALKVLVKSDDKATCKNFIDLVDEVRIADISVIAPVEMMGSEYELLKAELAK